MSNPKYDNPLKATFNGILDLFKKQIPIGQLSNDETLEGKTCLVTGANSGLGFAIATQLSERGARVIMACRNDIPNAGIEVMKLSGNKNVDMLFVDLSDLLSIDNLVEQLKEKSIHIDICIFNAAVVPKGSLKTSSGFDQMFLVNYLSTFKLANLLLSENIIVANAAQAPRLIFVSSESHRTQQPIDVDHLGVFENYTMGKVIALYGYYKLLMNTFATELSRRLNADKINVSVFALCPGPINSNIARAAPKIFMPLLKLIFALFFKSPKEAAAPVLYLACSHSLQNTTGMYLHLMQQKMMDDKALDPISGKKLWEKSEALLKEH